MSSALDREEDYLGNGNLLGIRLTAEDLASLFSGYVREVQGQVQIVTEQGFTLDVFSARAVEGFELK